MDIYNYIMQNGLLSLSEYPNNLYQHYIQDWMARLDRASIMPPSPQVIDYYIKYILNDQSGSIEYETQVNWSSYVYDLAKEVEPYQITHRSRAIALAPSIGRIHEIDYRLGQYRQWLNLYPKYTLSESLQYEIYNLIIDETIKHLKFNKIWIKEYINEHRTSSLGGGHKWSEVNSLTDSQLIDIMDTVKANLELLKAHPGWYNTAIFNSGIRARSERLKAFRETYSYEITRSRIIFFHPSMSIWTLFIPEKAHWYTKIINEVLKIIQFNGELDVPYIIGGKIYSKMSDYFTEGKRFIAADGKSWETSVGAILGSTFNPFMIYLGASMLPSGITVTSLLGTIANIIMNKSIKGNLVALGDDMNYFGCKDRPIVPWIEVDENDTKYKYALGLTYLKDPKIPRITGFKISADRGDLMRPLHISTTEMDAVERKKRDVRTRVAHAGMFFGQFGKRTLIDAVNKISGNDYIAPTAILDKIVEKGAEEEDIYAWTEGTIFKHAFQQS